MGVRLLILCAFLVLNSLLLYKAVWGTNGLLDHRELKQQQEAAEAECRNLDLANMALSREIRLLQTSDAYMEKMIRERLHYLRSNEILYLFNYEQSDLRETHERKN